MKRYPLILLTVLFVALQWSSCKKTEVNTISGNQAPVDTSISRQTLETYANRLFIILLGRKGTEAELNNAFNDLVAGKGGIASRKKVVADIMTSPEYYANVVEIVRLEIIDGASDQEIQRQIQQTRLLLNDPRYAPFKELIEAAILNLENLLSSKADLEQGKINMAQLHKLFCNNTFYDEINMGTENFVVSTFLHFLDRYPTNVELENAKAMVDGKANQLFLQNGQNKQDYLNIFFSSPSYFEGQVVYLYQKYLFRRPNTYEMFTLAEKYMADNDYKALQSAILTADEFLKP